MFSGHRTARIYVQYRIFSGHLTAHINVLLSLDWRSYYRSPLHSGQLSCLQLLQHFARGVGVGAMLQLLQATGSMLAVLRGRPGFDKVAQNEATKFKDLLQKADQGEEDWPGICDLVRKVGFEAADADALLDIIVLKMSSGDSLPNIAVGKASRTTTQKFESCLSFLTAAVWDKVAEGHTAELFEHLCKLGLRHPSETTSATLAMAVLHITDGKEAAMAMHAFVRTKFIKTIKHGFKALAKKQPKLETYIAMLPPTVEQFRSLWPEVYDIAFKDAPPVASRVQPIALDGLKSITPMRAAKMQAPSLQFPGTVGSMPHDMQTMGQQFIQMMSCMMGMDTGRQHMRLPKIEILNGASPSLPSASAIPAIMDTPPAASPSAKSVSTTPPTSIKPEPDEMHGQPATKRSIAEVAAEIGAAIDKSKTNKDKAKGKAKGAAKVKAKTKATPKEHTKEPVAKMTKVPVSKVTKCKATAKDTTIGLLLGCPKCRGSRSGCSQCRLPSYTGKRFQKK